MPLHEKIKNKTAEQGARLKGIEIAKIRAVPRTQRAKYEIELLEINAIDQGVEVFARVWKNGTQIGFGKDGTVDVERFRLINPPITVADQNGDIINDYTDETGNQIISRGREDLKEALLHRLEGALEAKKEKFTAEKIIRGKIGSTTTVVDYTAGSGAAGGSTYVNIDGAGSYATAHDGATADAVNNITTNAVHNMIHNSRGGSAEYYVRRTDLQFATGAIPDTDVISAASVTLYGIASDTQNVDTNDVVLLDNTNNGNISDPLATEDMNDFTTTSIGSRALADWDATDGNRAIDLTTFGAINKTGNTRIGVRLSKDISNTDPAINAHWNVLRIGTGTSGDNPFLTVEHAAASTNYTKDLTETITLVDTVKRGTGKSIKEAIALVDVVRRGAGKAIEEVITLVDTVDIIRIFTEMLTETITLVDGIKRDTAKILTETVTLVDTVRRAAARLLADTFTLVDTITINRFYVRAFSEVIALSDSIQKATGKFIAETITLVDTVAKRLTAILLTDVITLVASMSTLHGYYKALTETITLVATLTKVSAYSRRLTESISLATRLFLNGVNAAWLLKYTRKATTWIGKYTDPK